MSGEAFPDNDENPFSTRFVRPGAIEYLFPADCDLEQLVDRFQQHDARGEIVGPHGSGKSTLLCALLARLADDSWNVYRCDLRDGQRALPSGWLRTHSREPRALLAIDGYEQLSRWQRFRVLASCRRHGCGLLVTAHAPVGLPLLWTTEVDALRASAVFQKLVPGAFVAEADLHECLRRDPTNLRATLFALYDLYEQRRRASPGV
ncbi:MAG: hypothetical protein SGJ19_24935 [Planctomycetia bacterium]|nr:hypothetical protein [Planctomycetia bacterium]